MIGNNELILNHATMIEAMQHWLDCIMVKAPKVVGVKASPNSGAYTDYTFVISLSERKSLSPDISPNLSPDINPNLRHPDIDGHDGFIK